MISDWMLLGASFTAKEAASLHGKLVHMACIFPLIRPFLCSIAAFTTGFCSMHAHLHPSAAVRVDLPWVQSLLSHLPNSIPITDPSPVDIGWWGDASTSFGIGVIVQKHWAVWHWASGFKVGPKRDFDISWAEATAIELGLRLALHLGKYFTVYIIPSTDFYQPFKGIITHQGASENVTYLVRSDDIGMVEVMNKGRSCSLQTNAVLKHVYQLQAENGFRLHTVYVPTRTNIADALSRGDIKAFMAGFPGAEMPIPIPLPPHLSGKLIQLL